MKIIEKEGNSTSKIIEEFMQENNLELNDFKFEVIEEGTSSFLNLFGSKPTRVKFYLPDTEESLRIFATNIISKLNVKYRDIKIRSREKEYFINLEGVTEPGFIIGKEAKLLDSLQYLLNQMINKQEKKQLYIKLDVDGYREKRKASLLKKVKSTAEKVKQKNRSITLEPMHAANRRIVHQFIEKDSKLKTITIGEGEYKRVTILPADKIKDFQQRNKKKRKSYSRKKS